MTSFNLQLDAARLKALLVTTGYPAFSLRHPVAMAQLDAPKPTDGLKAFFLAGRIVSSTARVEPDLVTLS